MSDENRSPIGVGVPGIMLLEAWAFQLRCAFGSTPYLVGTAAKGKTWRDVDIRMMLRDDEYERICGKPARPSRFNPRWSVLCTALSVWGQQQTGLPIDFQFQTADEANGLFRGCPRIPLIALSANSGDDV